jgi:uncharacterized protein (TIGR02145 family)
VDNGIIYTGAVVNFIAPVIIDPNNGNNATYTWTTTNGTPVSGSGQQWQTKAPPTPTTGFGTTVTINQTGYCEDKRSLPGLRVDCQPPTGTLTAYADGKTVGDIYFNKAQNLKLYAIYNGTEAATSYTWDIGGQYVETTTVTSLTVDASDQRIKNLTAPGTYILTVSAKKGDCTLQTVTYNIFVSDCPYTGSDLLIDATYRCEEINTGSDPYYKAYISIKTGTGETQIYPIVQLPDNLGGRRWWFAKNSTLGNPQGSPKEYYPYGIATNACPSSLNWYIPTQDEWNYLFIATGASTNFGESLRSTTFGTGTDIYGFSAINTHYYSNGTNKSGDDGTFAWTSATDKSIRIQTTAAPQNDFSISSGGMATVRCIHQL